MNDIVYAGKHLLTHSVTRHAHDSWELIYCTEGSGTFSFDGGTSIDYTTGDVVVIPPGIPHNNQSSLGFTNIHLNLINCTLSVQAPTLVHDDSNAFILNAFSAAYYHFCGTTHQRSSLLSAYGNLIVCYLSAYQNARPYSKVVKDIENHIIQNYSDCNFELDEYLRSFPFSYDYLRKLFKKEIGVTPHKFLIDKRLQTAADNLRHMELA